MHTLLLVILYLSLTNVASMRRIENRVSCERSFHIHRVTYLSGWKGEGEQERDGEREGGREKKKDVSYKFLNVTRRLH